MKRCIFYLGICLTFLCSKSFGQFTQVWSAQYQHTFTPNYSTESRKVVEDPLGNIFVLSDVVSDIDPQGVAGISSYHYVTLVKYSTTGVKLAVLNIEVKNHITYGYDNFNAFGMETDASGNIYVAYSMYTGPNTFDVGLDKYNNNLSLIYHSYYSMNGQGYGIDMKVHPNGRIYALVKGTSLGTTSHLLIKSSNTSGPASLVYSYLGNNAPVLFAFALDGGSKAYVAGYRIKGTIKNAYVGAIDINTGMLNWSTSYSATGNNGDAVANQITVGADGGIYTVGTTYTGPSLGDQVLVMKNFPGIARFDFVVVLKGVSNNKGQIINAAESGWVYVGSASSTTASVFRIPNNGIFTVPGKVEYNPVPSSAYNSITGLTLKAMKISTSKNIYITGALKANGPSGDFSSSYFYKTSVVFGNALQKTGDLGIDGSFTHNYEGMDLSLDYAKLDVYLIRNFWSNNHTNEYFELIDLGVPSPLRKLTIGKNDLTISPNPARADVSISSNDIIDEIALVDLTGKLVARFDGGSNQFTFNTEDFENGIYVCRILTQGAVVTRRLIIE